ncbi:MAG: glutaminyl-peptide cyclotransferase, partial [Terracidiphilus sp.]
MASIQFRMLRSRRQRVNLHEIGAPCPCLRTWESNTLTRLFALMFLLFLTTTAHAADSYRVLHTYPHDQQAFTQGLVFVDGYLYESTGLNGHSSLRMEDVSTSSILRLQPVADKYFAEGLTDWGSTLIQLTWQAHIAFVYDRATFRLLRTFHYDGEGWGLT